MTYVNLLRLIRFAIRIALATTVVVLMDAPFYWDILVATMVLIGVDLQTWIGRAIDELNDEDAFWPTGAPDVGR